jgi:hypothetical protein
VGRRQAAPRPPIRIDITITLPHRPRWLLAGIALGSLHLPGLVVQLAASMLRAGGKS